MDKLQKIENEEGIYSIKKAKIYCEVILLEKNGYIVKEDRKIKIIEKR